MGPMISKGAKARAERLIQDSLDAGADMLLDGRYFLGKPPHTFIDPLTRCPYNCNNRTVKRLRDGHHRET